MFVSEAKFNDAPGCFGFASTFSIDGVCKTCSVSERCQERASGAVKLMQERRVQAAELLAQHRAFRADRNKETASLSVGLVAGVQPKRAPSIFEMSDEQKKLVEALPVKVQPELRKIFERGIPFRQELEGGANPIRNSGGKPAYLEYVCDLLLSKGSVDRKWMRDALSERFGWTYGTTNSHVTILSSLLPALGIKEQNGSFVL